MPWSTWFMLPSIPGCALADADVKTLLEVRGLSVSFRTERGLVRAVDNVSFQIGEREIIGVVG